MVQEQIVLVERCPYIVLLAVVDTNDRIHVSRLREHVHVTALQSVLAALHPFRSLLQMLAQIKQANAFCVLDPRRSESDLRNALPRIVPALSRSELV